MVTQSQKTVWYQALSLRFPLTMFTEAGALNAFLRNSGKDSNLPSVARLKTALTSDLILQLGSTTTLEGFLFLSPFSFGC